MNTIEIKPRTVRRDWVLAHATITKTPNGYVLSVFGREEITDDTTGEPLARRQLNGLDFSEAQVGGLTGFAQFIGALETAAFNRATAPGGGATLIPIA